MKKLFIMLALLFLLNELFLFAQCKSSPKENEKMLNEMMGDIKKMQSEDIADKVLDDLFIYPNKGIGNINLDSLLETIKDNKINPLESDNPLNLYVKGIMTNDKFLWIKDLKVSKIEGSNILILSKNNNIIAMICLNDKYRTSIGDISVSEFEESHERLPQEYKSKKKLYTWDYEKVYKYFNYHGIIFISKKGEDSSEIVAIAVYKEKEEEIKK
ncbi:MAG: hypothetical protein ABIA04_04330 [Pseudomonadota bacterium]